MLCPFGRARAMSSTPNLLRRVGTSPTVAEARTLGVQFLSERGFSQRRTHLLLVLAFAWFVTIFERLRRKNRNKNYRSRKRNPNSNCNYPPRVNAVSLRGPPGSKAPVPSEMRLQRPEGPTHQSSPNKQKVCPYSLYYLKVCPYSL